MKVIDQDGERLVWAAVYMRYGTKLEAECDSLGEALGLLSAGVDSGACAAQEIRCPNGRVITGDELTEAMIRFEEGEPRRT